MLCLVKPEKLFQFQTNACWFVFHKNMMSFLNYVTATLRALFAWRGSIAFAGALYMFGWLVFIRPSSDGTYYSMVMSVRPGLRPSDSPSVRPSDSIHPSVRLSVRVSVRPFSHFSHTCFDILSWNFAHDFVLMYYRSSLSVVTLRQFLKTLCLFVNLEYR